MDLIVKNYPSALIIIVSCYLMTGLSMVALSQGNMGWYYGLVLFCVFCADLVARSVEVKK